VIFQQINKYQFIDPAIGKGVFLNSLIKIIQRIADHYDISVASGWWREHIMGWDINSEMINYCREKFDRKVIIKGADFLLSNEECKADIIVGNPPYVRQELLDESYKNQIFKEIVEDNPELSISKRSDLYIYFTIKCLSILNPQGICTLIVPNSWMSTKYGEGIRQIIKNQMQLLSIIDSDQRHFSKSINTVILTILNRKPVQSTKIELSLGSESSIILHRRLPAIDMNWNGLLFNCPEWLNRELDRNKSLIPLGQSTKVSTGIITGNNRKYYSRERINGDFVPALRSPRDIQTIKITPAKVTSWLNVENAPFAIRTAPIVWADLRGGRHITGWNKYNLPFEHTFYGLTPLNSQTVKKWVLILNSSWVWLMVEIFGRKALGGGAIRLVKADLIKLPVPNPDRIAIPADSEAILTRPVENWETELHKTDRFILDQTIFNFLGLARRYDECMDLLKKLIQRRFQKARVRHNG
jgi:hypothetical protein